MLKYIFNNVIIRKEYLKQLGFKNEIIEKK